MSFFLTASNIKPSYEVTFHNGERNIGRCEKVQRFAELLIRQCAMKANATALDLRNIPELDARKYVGDCILKCFAVEE